MVPTPTRDEIQSDLLLPPTVQPISESPKQTISLTSILVLLIVVLICITTYLFLQIQKLSTAQTVQKELPPIPSPQASPSANPAADWQTYTNSKNSYTIQYPSNFTAGYYNAMSGEFRKTTGNDDLVAFLAKPEDMFKEFLEIQIVNFKINKKTFASLVNETYQKQKNDPNTVKISTIQTDKMGNMPIEYYSFSSLRGLDTPSWDGGGYPGDFKEMFIDHSTYSIAIIMTDSTLFNQVLATFRLVDQTNSLTDSMAIIKKETAPMVWSLPVDTELQVKGTAPSQGTLIAIEIPGIDEDKLAPLLKTDSILTTKYGWQLVASDFDKDTQVNSTTYSSNGKTINIRADYLDKLYSVFVTSN